MGIRTQVDDLSDAGLATDARWLLVQRIIASPGFVNSQRLSAFLLYVTRQSLMGKSDALNERMIGEEVFERPADYDPRDDNIVRSHASRLRVRLEEYFDREGASEGLRVQLPRGSYVPIFEVVESVPEPAEPVGSAPGGSSADEDEASVKHLTLPVRRAAWLAGALVVLTAITTAVVIRHNRNAAEQEPSHKLWSQMFRPQQETLIVPADSSLVITKILSGSQVPLASYAGGRYRADPLNCNKPCDQGLIRMVESLRYTSMSDLEFAVRITHIPEAIADRTEIRYARDIELKDLKESNVILAGSQEADPWMAAISGEMSFVIRDDSDVGALRVENRHPQQGEKSEYSYDSHDAEHRGLATVSFLPNLGGTGNLLVVQGFTVAGTQAAAEFVTSRKDLDALMQPYCRKGAVLPHFEILLSTVEINGMSSHAVPLAWHVHP